MVLRYLIFRANIAGRYDRRMIWKGELGDSQKNNGVGVFPTEKSCLGLVSALWMEKDEAWQIGEPYRASANLD